jgi:DNA-binding YbaB/EbfC family protein
MAKRRQKGGFGRQKGGQMGGMLQQIQKLQDEMVKTQDSLADEAVSVTAGGGAIEVTITGQQQLTAVKIDPEVVDPEDVEMLQDLIVAAVNEALEQSKALAAERMGALTGGLEGLLPPGLGLG